MPVLTKKFTLCPENAPTSLAGNRGRVERLGGLGEGRPFFSSSIELPSPAMGWFLVVIGQAEAMDQFNAGFWQLGLLVLLFAGLQVWWIGGTLRRNRQRDLARPMSGREFKRSLERIFKDS